MYKALPNDEVRILVIHMQGPLWTVLTLVQHRAQMYNGILEKNGAKLFRRVNACAFRYIGAPYATLNTRYFVFLSRELIFEIELLESAKLSPSWPDFQKKSSVENRSTLKKIYILLLCKVHFSNETYSESDRCCDVHSFERIKNFIYWVVIQLYAEMYKKGKKQALRETL